MYCTECGLSIPDNAKFCQHCGHKTDANQNNDSIYTGNNFENCNQNYSLKNAIHDQICILKSFSYITMPSIVLIKSEISEICELDEPISPFVKYILSIDTEEMHDDFEISSIKSLYSGAIKDINSLVEYLMNLDGNNSNQYFSQFTLNNEHALLSFSKDITTIIRQEMGRTYSSLGSKISKIKSQEKAWNEATNSGTNEIIINFAQYFAGGALAAANPLIGIPMLLGKFLHGKSKNDKNIKFTESFANDCDDLVKYCSVASEKRIDTIMQIRNLTESKFLQVYNHIEKAIDDYSIKFKTIDKYQIANFVFEIMKSDIKEVSQDVELEWLRDIIIEEDISFKLKKCFVA